jgi:hypothetical protein
MKNGTWSQWRNFPHPKRRGYLIAPFGPGCYQLRNGDKLVLFGESGHVAHRMSTLLPEGYGAGGRKNKGKRAYVLKNINAIEYRTLACGTKNEALKVQMELKKDKHLYHT